MFEGFEQKQITTSGTTINCVKGGSGPGLLLLHGYPQTHAMWHKIAPRLAQDFTIVAADLRGYGDSGKPHGDPEHRTYAKRAMAQDQVEVMQQLGFETFYVVGHDRGARVSHRLTLDHPQRVQKLALLDISGPCLNVFCKIRSGVRRAHMRLRPWRNTSVVSMPPPSMPPAKTTAPGQALIWSTTRPT
jgi:pimeloyl-ACP methyl ester carboxylesterase